MAGAADTMVTAEVASTAIKRDANEFMAANFPVG
jgi:hypothetical protein